MDSGSVMELARYRLEQANDCLKAAGNNLESDLYKDALNRSYYCIFHSIRAVLALGSYDSKKHSGIISEFHKNFIKTEKFDKRFSVVIRQSFQIRNRSDYEDFYVVAKEDVVQQIENAKDFMQASTEYINKNAEVTGE
jgi:uncharacterized protein (UPF0332 family)